MNTPLSSDRSEQLLLSASARGLQGAELLDFVSADQQRRWQAGQKILIEAYLKELAINHDGQGPLDDDMILDLIYGEVVLREQQEAKPQLSEYLKRFPQYADSLRRQFELHDGLSDDVLAEAKTTEPKTLAPSGNDLPSHIGKYTVVMHLGSGGQGEVFRAIHPQLGRDVVIKWAARHLTEPLLGKLLEEGRILARLEDPGIVRVHDVDVCQNRPFMVMEYVPGRSLVEQIRHDRPRPGEAAALTARLAAILDRLHRQGILHRDIKPANILMDSQGQPRLLDFGLACLSQPYNVVDPQPEEGLSGTLQYMAPEQANGQTDRIGPRTDLFSLGAVFYQMLTGRPPYQGETQTEVWHQACTGKITPPRQFDPRIPPALERICLKAMAFAPENRFASGAEMERVLRRYLRRPRLMAIALGLTTLVLAVVLAIVFVPWQRLQPAAPSPPADVQAPALLSGNLSLSVWRVGLPGDSRKQGLKVGEDLGALPVRNGEQVQLKVKLTQPAYIYLVWLDSTGGVTPLYPWQHSFQSLPQQEPVQELRSPREDKRGWTVNGPSGMETALLLVRRTPLPPETDMAKIIGKVPPSRLRDPQEVVMRGVDAGRSSADVFLAQRRGLEKEAQEIDEPLLHLIDRLRPHFELIRAIRFAHEE